ncbi:MAG: hypothetical protein AAF492_26570 [Verrucomicrobiota bacterium]
MIRRLIQSIEKFSSVNGGWGYYDMNAHTKKPSSWPFSFFTGAILLALKQAEEAGFEVSSIVTRKAVKALQMMRKKDFTYLYSLDWRYRPLGYVNRPPSSLSRSQVCNLALMKWGDEKVTHDVLREWLNRLIDRNGWLSIGRKRPIPHETWFAVSGYFYLFAHYYAGLCIEELPADERPDFQQRIGRILIDIQEKDGSWWDFPLYDYHKPYGTAYALLALQACRLRDE